MQNLRTVPYLCVMVAVVVSTIIGMIHHISFSIFLKRTFVFYILIFVASKYLIKHLTHPKKLLDESLESIFSEIEDEKHLSTEDMDKDSTDDFVPLDLTKQYVDKNHNNA